MEQRRQLVLAVGIAEWSSALTHLHVLGEHGAEWDRVVGELHDLIQQWPTEAIDPRIVVAEATTYITERLDLLDELLTDE